MSEIKVGEAVMTKRKGLLEVSFSLLHDLLRLPEDVVIEQVREVSRPERWLEDTFMLKLSGPSLPKIEEGQMIPRVTGILSTDITRLEEISR